VNKTEKKVLVLFNSMSKVQRNSRTQYKYQTIELSTLYENILLEFSSECEKRV